jgi:hypothetical protein
MNNQEEKLTYFIYSATQFNSRSTLEKSMGRIYKAGWVVHKGKTRNFTEKRYDLDFINQDSIVVASGYPSKMKYQDVEIIE